MDKITRLVGLAKSNPAALSDDGWRTLAGAGIDTKVFGAAYGPPTDAPDAQGSDSGFGGFDGLGLSSPSGLLVHGPGSAAMLGQGGARMNSAVFAVLASIVRAYGEPTLRVWRGPFGDMDNAEMVEGHPADALLQDSVNPWMDADSFRAAVRWGLLTDGNYYSIIVRGGGGTIQTNTDGPLAYLWPTPPHMMRPARRKGAPAPITHYDYDIGKGRPMEVPIENVVHWRELPDPSSPMMGIGALRQVVSEIMTDSEAEQFIYYILRNSGVPGLVFSPPAGGQPFSTTVLESIKDSVRARTSGRNRGDVFVTPQPAEISQFQWDATGFDLSHIWSHTESRIASVLGWPAVLVGLSAGLDAATYNNTKSLREHATETVLKPAWIRDAQPWNTKLRDLIGLRPDEWVGFDWTGVSALQEDQDTRRDWLLRSWDSDLLTIGQVHDALDLDLPPGADPNARKSDVQAGAGMAMDGTARVLPDLSAGKAMPALAQTKAYVEVPEVEISEADITAAIMGWDAWAEDNRPELVGMLGGSA